MKKSFFILSLATLLFAACSSDDSTPSGPTPDPTPDPPGPVEQKTLEPNVGGYNEPNQVYIDLSTGAETVVKRDTWDLGFASSTNRVIINGSIEMAVKQLPTTNINEVQQPDPSVAVAGGSTLASLGYADDPTGVLNGNGNGVGTAIAEISENDADNKVYLVNLGKVVPNTTPGTGAPHTGGEARGWKKIRITRSGSDYVLQYADLDATTHKSVTISKNSDYNFTFFSFDTESVVNVQPQKDKWDLNFTVFTNYFSMGQTVTYVFADFVTTNIHGNTRVYKMEFFKTDANGEIEKDANGFPIRDEVARDASYDSFTASSVEEAKFTESSSDQRIIGGSWRGGGGPGSTTSIYNHVFYVVKDADGNLYKLKFLQLTNEQGVRGYPAFQYELLK